MKKIITIALVLQTVLAIAQSPKTENLVVITLDGMRWQEVFGGADAALVADKRFTHDSAGVIMHKFWSVDTEERRKEIISFFLEHDCSKGPVVW